MNAFFAWLNAVPVDKYQHFGLSVLLFALVHYFTGNPLLAFAIANLAHVIKKAVNYLQGSRDWNDIVFDIVWGVAGALLSWACLLTK